MTSQVRATDSVGAEPSIIPIPELRRVGMEIEVLAPVGKTRLDLADVIGSASVPFFHVDSEPSLVPGRPIFHHLSRGIEVLACGDTSQANTVVCRLVDDITIVPPITPEERDSVSAGALDDTNVDYRIVSDEARLVRLIALHANPSDSIGDVLDPIADLFASTPQRLGQGQHRLDDRHGASIAMAVPQMPGRDRVCEIITPVIECDYRSRLDTLLSPAQALGFTVPAEAAVHVHLDAQPFRDASRLHRVVSYFQANRKALWETFGTNEHCRRLGPASDELLEVLARHASQSSAWPDVEADLKSLGLTKYVDVNIVNLVQRSPEKDTIEFRILGPGIDAGETVAKLERLWAILGELW